MSNELKIALGRLAAAFPTANAPRSTLEVFYAELLDSMKPERATAAVNTAISECRKFPTIADLREIAGREAERAYELPVYTGPMHGGPFIPMPDYVKKQIAEMKAGMNKRAKELEPE